MTVHYEVVGRRATVRLDRPDVLNALDRPTLEQLALRFQQAAADDRVGVVVLTGTGERAFCTGADLAEQAPFLERPNDYWAWMGHFIAAINAIRDCPKPVVARLNGIVVGGGNELNLACDLAVGVEGAVIRHIGPSRGSLPSGGATQWLPIFVGDRRAREILLLNEEIPMPTALAWGLVSRVVPRAELDATVDDLCATLLAKLPEIVRATKAQLDFWKDLSWSLTIRMARDWLTLHAASDEVRAGLASFEQKRLPDYEALRSRRAPPAPADARPATAIRLARGSRRRCPFCGRGPLPRDTVFCGYCGQPLLGS
jgi:enoyl-CoA hydratase/carnithine racemase